MPLVWLSHFENHCSRNISPSTQQISGQVLLVFVYKSVYLLPITTALVRAFAFLSWDTIITCKLASLPYANLSKSTASEMLYFKHIMYRWWMPSAVPTLPTEQFVQLFKDGMQCPTWPGPIYPSIIISNTPYRNKVLEISSTYSAVSCSLGCCHFF